MSNEKTGNAAGASRALQPTETNPLDFVPDKIPFDTPYGPPISLDRAQAVIQAAVAEAKKRNWKMNIAVADSGGAAEIKIAVEEAQGPSSRDLSARNQGLRGRYQRYASQLSARVRWSHCLSGRHSTDRTGSDYRRNRLFGRRGFPGRNRQQGRRGTHQPTAGNKQMIRISRRPERWE